MHVDSVTDRPSKWQTCHARFAPQVAYMRHLVRSSDTMSSAGICSVYKAVHVVGKTACCYYRA